MNDNIKESAEEILSALKSIEFAAPENVLLHLSRIKEATIDILNEGSKVYESDLNERTDIEVDPMTDNITETIEIIQESVESLNRLNQKLRMLRQEDRYANSELVKELNDKQDEITDLKFRNKMLTEQYNKLITGDRAINRAMQIYVEMAGNPDYKRDEELFTPQDLIDLMGWIFSGDAEKYLKRIKYDWGMSV